MTARLRLGAAAVAALCSFALATACGDDDDDSSTSPLPDVARGGSELDSGTYRPVRFRPRTSFEVGEGWETTSTEGLDYFDITRENSFQTIVFQRVAKVAPPRDLESAVPAPRSLVRFIRRHPSLDAGRPVKTTFAGLSGKRIDATVEEGAPASEAPPSCEGPCLPLFVPADGTPVSYEPGDRLRFIVLKTKEGLPITITVAATGSLFERFLPLANQVLSTVKFGAK